MKLCSKEGCTHIIVKGGVCVKHGAKLKRCSNEGCTNIVVKGGVCVRHGAKLKRCRSEGCTNNVQQGGVCMKHGAKVKLCSSEGCTNQAKQKGLCCRHGAYRNPHDESTAFDLSCRSAYDETTTTLPHQHTVAVSTNKERSREPPQVILCQVTDYREV